MFLKRFGEILLRSKVGKFSKHVTLYVRKLKTVGESQLSFECKNVTCDASCEFPRN